ncbi:MAG: hypothetical protein ABR985_12955 [Methanotrichaceae archaeon]
MVGLSLRGWGATPDLKRDSRLSVHQQPLDEEGKSQKRGLRGCVSGAD